MLASASVVCVWEPLLLSCLSNFRPIWYNFIIELKCICFNTWRIPAFRPARICVYSRTHSHTPLSLSRCGHSLHFLSDFRLCIINEPALLRFCSAALILIAPLCQMLWHFFTQPLNLGVRLHQWLIIPVIPAICPLMLCEPKFWSLADWGFI